MEILRLTKNMRLVSSDTGTDDADRTRLYADFLLQIGEGRLAKDEEGRVDLPDYLNVTGDPQDLIQNVFEGIVEMYRYEKWLMSRAILATTNRNIDFWNDVVGNMIPGLFREYLSADSVQADNPEHEARLQSQYPPELLNSLEGNSSLPQHKLRLKEGFIVILLRNIHVLEGHVNGARYIIEGMTAHALMLRSVSEVNYSAKHVLPRMNCASGDDNNPVIGFRRRQFPIRVCFAMTINKAQEQSVSGKLSLDLRNPCFAHGQLYVGLSRTTNPQNVTICTHSAERKTKKRSLSSSGSKPQY